MESAITVRDVSKTYRLYSNPWHRLTEALPWAADKRHREVPALHGINLDVPPGTAVGLIGGNGAGKSTLLKILTGTTFPTSGSYTIRGRVAALLELGAGFNHAFSGRENIFMNAALLGFSRKEAQRKYQEILEFSELGDFINAPVRTYSSGMAARLGFSVAVATDPDILIIDEILAVGDMHFRRKCIDRIMRFRERGKTMFFCSHSLYDVRQICDRAIWLRDGKVKMFDDAVLVTNEYATYENALMADQSEAKPWNEDSGRPLPRKREYTKAESGEHASIVSAQLVDPRNGAPRNAFAPREDVAVRVHVRNGAQYEPLHLAIGFTRSDGTLCLAMTTEFDDVLIEANEAVVTLRIPKIPLLSGEFVVPVWLLDEKGLHRFHEMPCTDNLIMQNRDKELGVFLCERSWDVEVLAAPPTSEPPLSHRQ